MAPRLRDDGFICAAPPCSLFGPACASVHKRNWHNVEGDKKVFKVRLANRVWKNFVSCQGWKTVFQVLPLDV